MDQTHHDQTHHDQSGPDEQELLAELFEQPSWEERYAGSEAVWSGRVNPQLATEAAELTPGRALDIGSGEGADAIWLAERGWSVTGIDFSTVALKRAAEHAESTGVADRIDWRHLDIRTFAPAEQPERWDLVTSQYMHQPDGGMVEVTRRLADAVAPGGTLLVVGHHPGAPGTAHEHHARFTFAPEDLLPALDPSSWEIRTEVRARMVEDQDGQQVSMGDSVLLARRRA